MKRTNDESLEAVHTYTHMVCLLSRKKYKKLNSNICINKKIVAKA